METIEIPGARLMWSPNINYLRVDVQGLLQMDAYRAALDSAELWKLVADKQVANACLNHIPSWKFSTDYYFYLRDEWLPHAGAAGLRRVSVVVQEQVHMMLANVFQPLEGHGVTVRFFPQAQFEETSEWVSWFA